MEGVVTPGQGVICNQRVVSWDFEGSKDKGTQTETAWYRYAGHRRVFTSREFLSSRVPCSTSTILYQFL